jgi:hypothetical protein
MTWTMVRQLMGKSAEYMMGAGSAAKLFNSIPHGLGAISRISTAENAVRAWGRYGGMTNPPPSEAVLVGIRQVVSSVKIEAAAKRK